MVPISFRCRNETEFAKICHELSLFSKKVKGHERILLDNAGRPIGTGAKACWLCRIVTYFIRFFSCTQQHPAQRVAENTLKFFCDNRDYLAQKHLPAIISLKKIKKVSGSSVSAGYEQLIKFVEEAKKHPPLVDHKKEAAENLKKVVAATTANQSLMIDSNIPSFQAVLKEGQSQPAVKDNSSIQSTLKLLAPHFGDPSVIIALEHLPIEQIIDLSLNELLLFVFNNAPEARSDDLYHLIHAVGSWRTPSTYENMRQKFTKILTSLKTDKQQKEFSNYLEQVFKLILKTECHKTILQAPLDEKTKSALFHIYARSTTALSKNLFRFCECLSQKSFESMLESIASLSYQALDRSLRQKKKYQRPPNLKSEVMSMLCRQFHIQFVGKRYINLTKFLKADFSLTSPSQNDVMLHQPLVFQTCDRIFKISSDLRKQCLLFELHLAAQKMCFYSSESENFQKEFLSQVFKVVETFYTDMISRLKTTMEGFPWLNSEVHNSNTIVQKIFQILEIETDIFRYEFEGKISALKLQENSRKKIESCNVKKGKELEELQKLISADVRKFIEQICKIFREEMQKCIQKVQEMELRHYNVDPLLNDPEAKEKFPEVYYSLTIIDQILALFNLIATSEKIIFPNHIKTLNVQLVFTMADIRSMYREHLGNLNNVAKMLSQFQNSYRRRVAFDAETKEFWNQSCSGLEIMCKNIRQVIGSLDGFSAAMTIIRTSFSHTSLFMPKEVDTKIEEFNENEKEWLKWLDNEQDDEVAQKDESSQKIAATKKKKRKAKSKLKKTTVAKETETHSQLFIEQPFKVDHYRSETSQLLAVHRHQLRRYYRVPDYIVTPISLLEKPFSSPEVALQQQILSTDCLQWIVGMLEVSRDQKLKQLLTTYLFWWLHLGTEQGLTSKALKRDSESQLTHKIEKLCQQIGLKAKQWLMKGHIWGTDYIRYPFTVPKPSKNTPLAYRHVTHPTTSTVDEVMQATEAMMKGFVKLQDYVLEIPDSADATKKTAESDRKTSFDMSKKQEDETNVPASPLSTMLGPNATQLKEQMASLETAKSRLQKYIETFKQNTPEAKLKKSVLLNVQFHMDNLSTVMALIIEQPVQENMFVQMCIAYLSTQYFCENLGHYLALEKGLDERKHNLMRYVTLFGLGNYKEKIIDQIKKVNLGKGSEYLFQRQRNEEVMDTIRYLSGLFASSKYVTLTREGISLPQTAEINLSQMHEEMILRLKRLALLAVQLVQTHIP